MKIRIGLGITAALLASIFVAMLVGVNSLTPSQWWNGLTDSTSTLHSILWQIRLPRIALALLVGASLAVAGAVSQGVFANPIAEPSIIGIASGAALGIVVASAVQIVTIGTWQSVVAALVGALVVASLMVRWVPKSPLAFLLTGIAIAAMTNALVGLVTSMADRSDLRSISFWSLGSLALATWSSALAIAPFVLIGLVIALVIAPRLDYLALGNARHLGISLTRLQASALIALAFLVAGSVALTGVITFVGLVVPHVLRLLVGPSHRALIALSALGGALLVLIADTISRTVLQPMELPIGLLTAIVGAPILLISVRSLRSQQ